jgi:hypothetical protein
MLIIIQHKGVHCYSGREGGQMKCNFKKVIGLFLAFQISIMSMAPKAQATIGIPLGVGSYVLGTLGCTAAMTWGNKFSDCYESVEEYTVDKFLMGPEQIFFAFESATDIDNAGDFIDVIVDFFVGFILLDDQQRDFKLIEISEVKQKELCFEASKLEIPEACLTDEERKEFNEELATINALKDTSISVVITDINKNQKKGVDKKTYKKLMKSRRAKTLKLFKSAAENEIIGPESFSAIQKISGLIPYLKK